MHQSIETLVLQTPGRARKITNFSQGFYVFSKTSIHGGGGIWGFTGL